MEIPSAAVPAAPIGLTAPPRGGFSPPPASFSETLGAAAGAVGRSIHRDTLFLDSFRTGLVSGRAFRPEELLAVQMRASALGLRVELVAKIAEGALSLVRRIQGAQ